MKYLYAPPFKLENKQDNFVCTTVIYIVRKYLKYPLVFSNEINVVGVRGEMGI